MPSPTPYIAETGSETPVGRGFPDARELLTIVIERAWIGLFVAAAVFLAFWLDARRQVPYYRSRAQLMVEAQVPQLFNFQDALSFSARNLEYFNTHIKALYSRSMMERAIAEGGLANHPRFLPGIPPGPAQADAALRFVTIAPVEKSRLIDITVEHPDPQVAADLANALARAYIQIDLDNRMNASMKAVEWLRARAEENRAKVEAGLLELQKYRESTQSVSLEDDQNIVIAKLKALNSSVTDAETQRIALETQWRQVERRLQAGDDLTQSAMALDDPSVREAHRQWQERERELAALKDRYLPEHPDYQAALRSAATLKQNYETVCARAVESLRNRYELAREKENSLREALRRQEQEAFELDRKLVRYNELKRNVEAEQTVYQALINRMKEASISGTLPSELIRLVEAAQPAAAPFRPNPSRAATRGAALGLALGLLAIFGSYYADHRIRRAEEVERQLGLPVLGSLPSLSESDLAARGTVAHREDSGEAAEAFRTLRTRLTMDAGLRDRKCLVITSAHAGEGKSFVASNLAISFAQDGQRTLLVGADLRRPSLHKVYELGESPGLAELLSSDLDWRAVVRPAGVPGLDLCTAGAPPRHPAELLGRRRMKAFLDGARQVYDRIVVDAPPVLGLSDGLILLGNADGVLLVVRYGFTHSFNARQAVNRLDVGGAPCAGVVFNGVNRRTIANYYYYRRYQGYYTKTGGGERAATTSASAVSQ